MKRKIEIAIVTAGALITIAFGVRHETKENDSNNATELAVKKKTVSEEVFSGEVSCPNRD